MIPVLTFLGNDPALPMALPHDDARLSDFKLHNFPSQFIPKLDEANSFTKQQATSESPTHVDTANIISPEEQSEYERFFDEATFDDVREIADILGVTYQGPDTIETNLA